MNTTELKVGIKVRYVRDHLPRAKKGDVTTVSKVEFPLPNGHYFVWFENGDSVLWHNDPSQNRWVDGVPFEII